MGFVFEELPVATFADLWPGHTPKDLFLVRATCAFGSDPYFSELSRSFAHVRECFRTDKTTDRNFVKEVSSSQNLLEGPTRLKIRFREKRSVGSTPTIGTL